MKNKRYKVKKNYKIEGFSNLFIFINAYQEIFFFIDSLKIKNSK